MDSITCFKKWYWSITCDCITVILRDSGCQSLSCWKHIACWAYKYPFYFPRKGGKAHLKKEFWHSQQSQPRHSVSQTATTIQKIGFVKNPIFPILSVKFNLAKQPTDKTAFLSVGLVICFCFKVQGVSWGRICVFWQGIDSSKVTWKTAYEIGTGDFDVGGSFWQLFFL